MLFLPDPMERFFTDIIISFQHLTARSKTNLKRYVEIKNHVTRVCLKVPSFPGHMCADIVMA